MHHVKTFEYNNINNVNELCKINLFIFGTRNSSPKFNFFEIIKLQNVLKLPFLFFTVLCVNHNEDTSISY